METVATRAVRAAEAVQTPGQAWLGSKPSRKATVPGLAAEPAAPQAGTKQAGFDAAPAARGAGRQQIAARALPTRATPAQRRAPSPQPDFLFGRPRASVGIRGLWHRARAGSDFYDFVNRHLFVQRSPDDDPKNPAHGLLIFDAPGIGFDFGFGVTSRLDVRVGVDYAKSFNQSEARDFRGSDGLPIEQTTELSHVDLRSEVAFALAPRGRAIGQYAWIPSRVVPYAGAGLGFVRYDLQQRGEFVDMVDFAIFRDALTSKAWGTGIHLFGGADVRLTRYAFLNVEVRHVQASAPGPDFGNFDPLDLGGLRMGAGVRFAF